MPMDPQSQDAPSSEQVAAFFRKHRTGLVALVFTDLVDSTALLNQLGDQAGASFLRKRREIIRDTLRAVPEAEEIETAGDSFLLVFSKPSDAVRFALLTQARLRVFSAESRLSVQERMGIHLGEVVISEHETEVKAKDLYGLQLATCARVMSLAQGAQILLTRGVFDSARQVLKGEDLAGVGPLSWVSHGPYVLKGIEEAVEVCEVGEAGQSPLAAPKTSEKAQRQVRPDEEPVLGWRPAVGLEVPNTKWMLEEKLGEGGFGEVWVARHQTLKERHVFKFCFRADRVRSLKREVTLFRLLKERVGEHSGIVRLYNVNFDQPPFYLEEEYVAGKDLRSWSEAQGGIEKVAHEVRLEIIAQAAEALQAAHDAGIIHRDVKPGNILISGEWQMTSDEKKGGPGEVTSPHSSLATRHSSLSAKLTDFGIGQVISAEYLAGVTKAGFTQTMLGSTSSGTGTTMYLAPEIVAGMPATTRSDTYSLGVVLYQLLVVNFTRPLTTDWAKQVADPLLREDLERCFAGNPEERFAGAAQLARSLRNLEPRRAELARRQADRVEWDRLRRQAEQRHKIVIVSAAVAVLLLLLALALGYGLRRAKASEFTSRKHAYASDMNLAQHALAVNNFGRARELLNRQRPRPGEKDLRGWEWRLLWRRCRGDALSELGPHSNGVGSLAFSGDGKVLAAGDWDGTVKLWNLGTGRELATLHDAGRIIAVTFLGEGDVLVSAGASIRFWEVPTGKLITEIAHEGGIRSFALSPAGTTFATLAGDRKVRLWNVRTKQVLATFPVLPLYGDHPGVVEYSPDGRTLGIGDLDGRVRLIDLNTRQETLSFPAHKDGVTAMAFSPDGRQLATGAGYGESAIVLWDPVNGTQTGRFAGHTEWISSLKFSPDGSQLASGSADQTVRLWDVARKQPVSVLLGHQLEVWSVALSPNGKWLVSGSKDGAILCWNPAAPNQSGAFETSASLLRDLRFSSDAKTILVLNQDGSVALWEAATLREKMRFSELGTNNVSVALSPDDKWFVAGSADGRLTVWDLTQQRVRTNLTVGTAGVGVQFFPDGKTLASREGTGAVSLWNVASWQKTGSWKFANAGPWQLSPDGRTLATAAPGGFVEIWDLGSNRKKGEFRAHKQSGADLAFSPKGELLASVSAEGSMSLWDTRSLQRWGTLSGHILGVHSVVFSPDGTRLATGSGGRETVKVWDLATREEVATLEGEGFLVRPLRFSPDGCAIAALNNRGKLHLWRAPSFAEIDAAEKAQVSGMARPPSAK